MVMKVRGWGVGGGVHVAVYVFAPCVFVCGGKSWIFIFTLARRNGGNCVKSVCMGLPLSHVICKLSCHLQVVKNVEMLKHIHTHFIMMWKKTSLRIIVHLIWSWCLFQMVRKGACLGQNLMEPGGSWKYRLTLTKRWMTTASPTHCLHLLMMTWTLKTLIPLMNCYQLKHVAGQSRLMSMACSPGPLQHTDPDFALALQKCRGENSILSIAVNVHNRRIDHAL